MSHVAKMKFNVASLEALADAAKQLGLELVRDQHTYRWFGRSVGDYPMPEGFTAADLGKCDHALRIPNSPSSYEIGVVKNKNGQPGYTLLWDFWQGGYGLQEKVGEGGKRLSQEYALQFGRRDAIKHGYRVRIYEKEQGVRVMHATR